MVLVEGAIAFLISLKGAICKRIWKTLVQILYNKMIIMITAFRPRKIAFIIITVNLIS